MRYTQSTRAGCDATITYTYDPAPPIDLTIAKTVTSSGPYIVGSNVTYSLLARNLGPGVAQPAIVVKDLLPTGLTYVSATGTNWTCAAAGPTITCTRAAGASTLAANASADAITVTAKVATGATGSLLNMAQVNPAANETLVESNPLGAGNNGYETGDPATGSNNDASATIAVTDSIDLTIAKTVTSSGPYIVGSNVAYSLVARNLGPGVAQPAIVVKDLLPTGLTYVSATGTNWTCAAAGQTITCTRTAAGTLAANASADAITVTAKVATGATGSLVNVAQVNPAANETLVESNPLGAGNNGYETGDPATGSNNDASATIAVTDSIDLTIAKTVTSSGPYIVGSNVAYSLVARNLGPGVAQPAIVVKDLLPTGLTYVSATGTNWTCAAAGPTITCTRAAGASTLAANASADAITVTAKVAAGATGSLVNLAQVNPAANETLVESNPLGAGNNGYETGDPATGSNNDASATIAVTDSIDLTIAKTVTSSGPYIVGSNVAYSLVARNLGPGVAQPAIVVKDLLPTGLTYVSATGTNWTCAAAGPTITCTRAAGAGTLASNASADAITVTAKVAAGATGSLVNLAQVNPAANETLVESNPLGAGNNGYETGDPAVGSNNDDSKAITVVQSIDLTIAKSVGAGAYTPGSNVTYSLLARNLGPGTAQAAIVVKDLLPTGLTYVSATGTNWTCAAAGQTITCTRTAAGTLAANASADAITVVAKVDAGVAIGTSLVNYAQVAPAGNETVPESNPLGTVNGGYEDGNPASGSNNDDSKAIVVTVATAVPTLNEWMLLLLSAMLGLLAMRQAQVRRHMK